MTIILLKKNENIEAYTALTKLCKDYKEFSYSYIKSKKFPFNYKGYEFLKIKVK